MNDILQIAAITLPSVLSGLVLGKFQRWQTKGEENSKLQRKENFLIMKNIDAIGCLAEQTAKCLRGEKINGELTSALEYRKNMQHELEDHFMEVSANLKNMGGI
ncbi:hypothetical protein [Anaerovorax odorimutans]|uniref:hypothetical protein n=1 Tax=Anaerovorax odorimutans TaxID=109327 RepID=UPI0004044630|nr:hypothetical protein [Anaerovorax odorimutans]